MHSLSGEIVTTVVYGTAATIIGLVTIYQAHRAWTIWREHLHNTVPHRSSLELGLASSSPTPGPSVHPRTIGTPLHATNESRDGVVHDISSTLLPSPPSQLPPLATLTANEASLVPRSSLGPEDNTTDTNTDAHLDSRAIGKVNITSPLEPTDGKSSLHQAPA
ncbi:hypothetical protein ABVK25_001728 [Lepraria finkii]|uniref:Uncharacterized protein n=1 Tax=Lepraria finkii TaxID=1340010 RepID=A0ABR4BK88_9LECA